MFRSLRVVIILVIFLILTPEVDAEENSFSNDKFTYQNVFLEISPEYDKPADWSPDKPSLIYFQRIKMLNVSGKDYDGKIEILVPGHLPDFAINGVGEYSDSTIPNGQSEPVEYKYDSEKNILIITPKSIIKAGASYECDFSSVLNPFESSDKKRFTWDFTAPTEIEDLEVQIYSPVGAKNFEVEPVAESGNIFVQESGEVLYSYKYSKLSAGEIKQYTVSYDKSDTVTTKEALNDNQDNDALSKNSSGSVVHSNIVAAIIIGISIIIFGVLLYFALSKRQVQNHGATRVNIKKSNRAENISYQYDNKIKKLRQQLIDGKINEDEYRKKLKELSKK